MRNPENDEWFLMLINGFIYLLGTCFKAQD